MPNGRCRLPSYGKTFPATRATTAFGQVWTDSATCRVTVHYQSTSGKARTLKTPLLAFTDTDDNDDSRQRCNTAFPSGCASFSPGQTAGVVCDVKSPTP